MAVKVNGELIEDSEVRAEAERMRPRYEQTFADMDAEAREGQLQEWSRENVIERVLVRQEAQRRNSPIESEAIESALKRYKEQTDKAKDSTDEPDDAQLREQIEMELRVQGLVDEVSKEAPEPDEQAIAEFYEQHKGQFRTTELVRVAHIVKHVNWMTDEATARQAIEEAYAKVQGGAVFEDLVRRYSDCPENGGDLGYISRGQMVEEFEDVVFNMGVGQMSEVFRSRFGFHIAKVYDRKPATQQSLEEVKDGIIKELKEQMQREAVEGFVDKLKESAVIEEG